jgi:hypothetical protein
MPLPDFVNTATILDMRRLGKQRVEAMQILRVLAGLSDGWKNHPAVRMWSGRGWVLGEYGLAMCQEWIRRGYRDTCTAKIRTLMQDYFWHERRGIPDWIGDEDFHASHRSNLLRKDPLYYGQFGWMEPSDLPYVWPV